MSNKIRFIVLACVPILAGCISNEPAGTVESASSRSAAQAPAGLSKPGFSGFLVDYSKLQPSPTHNGALVQRSERLSSFTSFIIDFPVVLPKATVRGTPIDPTTAAQLASDLRAEAIDALGGSYTITQTPGPGVARVRSAITRLARCEREPGTPTLKIGGASVEMEIIDSVSGERLAAVVENDAVTSTDPLLGSADPFYDTRLVFRHWSARLSKWLTDAPK